MSVIKVVGLTWSTYVIESGNVLHVVALLFLESQMKMMRESHLVYGK